MKRATKVLLYIHIPYCDSKCYYCSFNSYVDKFDTRLAYMQALHRQLEFELKRFSVKPGSLDTLFIGGGTPSTIVPGLYAPVFELLDPYLKRDAEITTEANPNSASESWLSGMRALGVNRVSFGVQSFDSAKLKALNRAHSPKEAVDAIHCAKVLGFNHLSLDIIYNFQGDTKALLLSDINQAFALPIDHISAYELTIEAKTHFAGTPEVRQENNDLARFVAQSIKERGFAHYEISNFGTYQSRHNKGYWRLEDYIGAGAGAVGFRENTRYYPQADIDAYIADPMKISEETVTENDLLTENIFLGLRSTVGIKKALLPITTQQRADYLVDRNKLTLDNDTYQNPDFFLADEIALYLLD